MCAAAAPLSLTSPRGCQKAPQCCLTPTLGSRHFRYRNAAPLNSAVTDRPYRRRRDGGDAGEEGESHTGPDPRSSMVETAAAGLFRTANLMV